MAIKSQITTLAYQAAEDLSAKKFFVAEIDGDGEIVVSGAGDVAGIGLIVTTATSGNTVSVCQHGPCWARAGASINAGDRLKSDASGELIPTTGDGDWYIARALEDAADGDEVSVFVDPGQQAA